MRLSSRNFHYSTLFPNNNTSKGGSVIRSHVMVRVLSPVTDEPTGEYFDPSSTPKTLPDVQALRLVEGGYAEYVTEEQQPAEVSQEVQKQQAEEQQEAQKLEEEKQQALQQAKTSESSQKAKTNK